MLPSYALFEGNASNDEEDRVKQMFPKITTNGGTLEELLKTIKNTAYQSINTDLEGKKLKRYDDVDRGDCLPIRSKSSFIAFNVNLYSNNIQFVSLPAKILSRNPISFSN
jgi:hypothetical protein